MPTTHEIRKGRRAYEEEIADDFQEFNKKDSDEVKIDLTKITIKRAIRLIQENVHNVKLGFKLDNGSTYFLNDKTINQLMRNRIEDEHLPDGNRKDNDYQELVSFQGKTKHIRLFRIEAFKRGRPAGGFFKYLNATHFDLDRYGIHKEVRKEHYADNCLFHALRNGGMEERKLELLKHFVKNRIIPKCKLKDVCEKLEITIKLTTIKAETDTRTEHFGDKSLKEKYAIGLLDEHYFLIERTQISSYSLNHYEDATL